jgi:hypothetical protein
MLHVGVGQIWAARLRGIPPWAYLFFLAPTSEDTGVGQNPHPLPDMGSPCIVCAQYPVNPQIPHLGQVSENSSQPPRSEGWGIFQEYDLGSYLANNPCEMIPESRAFSIKPFAQSCD